MSKGIFIPDITVEMLRKAPLEAVETLLVEGEMHDVDMPKWIPVENELPEYGQGVLAYYEDGDMGVNHVIDEDDGEWFIDGVIAWMPLPEPWKGEQDG